MRIKDKIKVNKMSKLLAEETRLSIVMEQREVLEKGLKGVEDAILISKRRLEGLKSEIVINANALDKKKKEIEKENKKIGNLIGEKGKLKNNLLEFNREWLSQETEYKKDIFELRKEAEKVQDKISGQRIKIAEIEEEKQKTIKKMNDEIIVKSLKSVEFDKILEGQAKEREAGIKEKMSIKKEINGLKTVKEELKSAGDNLISETDKLKLDKEKEDGRLAAVKKEIKVLEEKKVKAKKEFEREQLNIFNLNEKRKIVEVKAERVKELYKKAGQTIKI